MCEDRLRYDTHKNYASVHLLRYLCTPPLFILATPILFSRRPARLPDGEILVAIKRHRHLQLTTRLPVLATPRSLVNRPISNIGLVKAIERH